MFIPTSSPKEGFENRNQGVAKAVLSRIVSDVNRPLKAVTGSTIMRALLKKYGFKCVKYMGGNRYLYILQR